MSWDFFINHYPDLARQQLDPKFTWETSNGKRHVGPNPPAGSKPLGVFYPRSGTLGGCTAHNALVSVYPHDKDWELVRKLTGDETWNAQNMRRIFSKMENATHVPVGTQGHGSKGWLASTLTDLFPPALADYLDKKVISVYSGVAKAALPGFVPTVASLSTRLQLDMNRATAERDTAEGMYGIPNAIANGKRAGARDIIMSTYLAKTADGKKKYPLDIALNTLATKVLFSKTSSGINPTATGVEFLSGQYLYKASPRSKAGNRGTAGKVIAEKEVILAGGAYNTPQILKLSGIGSKSELAKHKIPIVVDLPGVGTNLQDHQEIGITNEYAGGFDIIKNCTWGNAGDPCLNEWRQTPGPSIYGSSNGFSLAVLKKTSISNQDKDFAGIPDMFVFGGIANFNGYYPKYSEDTYRADRWSWIALNAHTASRSGTVTLRSADPLDPPIVNFNFFDAADGDAGARDVQAMVEGLQLARKLTAAGDTPSKEIWPGQAVQTSKQLGDFVKAETWSHHASCSCPIGSDNDKMAVLDSKFRVRGVEGLRVADASVFPRVPGFFVAIPTYMIGEKAAEAILEGK
jgi:choline dehydrogenase